MVPLPPPSKPSAITWRELYRAAILELDPAKLPERILEAETALIVRAKELFQDGGGHEQETQDLDDAMYALQALRSALKYNPSAATAVDKPRDTRVA